MAEDKAPLILFLSENILGVWGLSPQSVGFAQQIRSRYFATLARVDKLGGFAPQTPQDI